MLKASRFAAIAAAALAGAAPIVAEAEAAAEALTQPADRGFPCSLFISPVLSL